MGRPSCFGFSLPGSVAVVGREDLFGLMVLEIPAHVNRPCCIGPVVALVSTSGVHGGRGCLYPRSQEWGQLVSQFSLKGHISNDPISSL